jgi:hypothetical protein
MITIDQVKAMQKTVAELETAAYELQRTKALTSVSFYYEGHNALACYNYGPTVGLFDKVAETVVLHYQRAFNTKADELRASGVDPASLKAVDD